jgi:hypothetical protein
MLLETPWLITDSVAMAALDMSSIVAGHPRGSLVDKSGYVWPVSLSGVLHCPVLLHGNFNLAFQYGKHPYPASHVLYIE